MAFIFGSGNGEFFDHPRVESASCESVGSIYLDDRNLRSSDLVDMDKAHVVICIKRE
jgi:hypothetical protein